MGLEHRTVLYYLSSTNVFCMLALFNRTRSKQAGRSAGFAARISMFSVWPRPGLAAVLPLRAPRLGIILLPFFWIVASALAQENLPPALETKIAAGVQALKSGDLNSADEVFSDALRQGIKHPLIYHNLGVLAQLRGNHAEAVTRFRQALSLQPNYGPSRLLLGSSLLALHKNLDALRELKRAVVLMPKEPQAHLQLAKAYGTTDNWIAAVQEFQKLVELAPQEPEYSFQLGTAWAKLSGWSYGQITRINPDSARLHQALGQEYVIQEKYDLALAAYRQAVRADPKMPELHLAMALILLELKKFDQALAEIGLELNLVPESKIATATRTKIEAAMATSSP
jgi:tetratricopeptide (TPR) repeat protein